MPGTLLGAVGVSGDSSDNDEVAAMAGIEAVGLQGRSGRVMHGVMTLPARFGELRNRDTSHA